MYAARLIHCILMLIQGHFWNPLTLARKKSSSGTWVSSDMVLEPQGEEPSTSFAPPLTSQLFDPEDEDPFASTPVTVAETERSFPELKLIKSYLGSTMSQERLTGLSYHRHEPFNFSIYFKWWCHRWLCVKGHGGSCFRSVIFNCQVCLTNWAYLGCLLPGCHTS